MTNQSPVPSHRPWPQPAHGSRRPAPHARPRTSGRGHLSAPPAHQAMGASGLHDATTATREGLRRTPADTAGRTGRKP